MCLPHLSLSLSVQDPAAIKNGDFMINDGKLMIKRGFDDEKRRFDGAGSRAAGVSAACGAQHRGRPPGPTGYEPFERE